MVLLSLRNALQWGYSKAAVVPSVRGPCEHDGDYTVACFFVKLGEKIPIDFGGQRSKVKVTMDIWK